MASTRPSVRALLATDVVRPLEGVLGMLRAFAAETATPAVVQTLSGVGGLSPTAATLRSEVARFLRGSAADMDAARVVAEGAGT